MTAAKKSTICQALLIDIAGKQDYIFSSNRLKENIGASHIIAKRLFGAVLQESIAVKYCKGSALEAAQIMAYWKTRPQQCFEQNTAIEVGYIGGGNALLLFSSTDEKQEEIKDFIRHYSYQVLKEYPGVQLVFGMTKAYDTGNLKSEGCQALRESLRENRMKYFSPFQPYKPGIAADCHLSGEAQEEYYKADEAWISVQSKVRIDTSEEATQSFTLQYGDEEFWKKYATSNDLEQINTAKEKNYIAIAHIDGNGMGKLFRAETELNGLRKLSIQVSDKLEASMNQLLKEFDVVLEKHSDIATGRVEQKKVLPFRSIINAGDDITFICHGMLGVYLAERYVAILRDEQIGGLSIPSCAGIAIVNKKYPFYRAYQLAEELAGAAKQASRGKNGEQQTIPSCWINFHISSGGYTGDFEDLMKRKYQYPIANQPALNHGPYQLWPLPEKEDRNTSFQALKDRLKKMVYADSEKERWPKNKLLELRYLLTASQPERDYFRLEMQARGLEIPDRQLNDFPYYDLIDLIDFYPEPLLNDPLC